MARTFTSDERAHIALGQNRHDVYAKLELRDPDGDWIDVTAFASSSWLNEFVLEETVDGNCQTMSASLVRELSVTNSLAPLIEASLRNRDNSNVYAPFLDVARQWRASVAVVVKGAVVGGGDWKEIGAGLYDIVEVNSPTPSIQITGRDWGASLLDCWIDEKKIYSTNGDLAMEDVIQELLDDNLGTGAITLYTPASPSFVMNAWEQQPMSLMQAINEVASKAGMVVRYRYDASDVSRLTLYAPDRTAGPGDEVWSLGQGEYDVLDKVKTDIEGVRNRILIKYWDAATSAGASVTAVNPVSITRYGGPHSIARTLSLDVSEDTNIETESRAQDLADAILSDLDAPPMEQMLQVPGFWIVQLGDYGKFLANATQYDTDQYGGVTSIRHAFLPGGGHATLQTTIGTRGQPSGRYRSWFSSGGDSLVAGAVRIKNFREKTRSSTQVTVQWDNEGNTEGAIEEIWLWYAISTQPVVADPWPSISTAPTKRLTAATEEYTFDIPDQNTILHGVLVPIGPRSVAGAPWRFTLQPSTQQRVIQRAKILSTTPQSCVVRVEVANPIAGGDVTISYVSSGLTVSPASPQTILAVNVPTSLDNPEGLVNYIDFTITRPAPGGNDRITFTASSPDRTSDVDAVDIPALDGIPQGVIAIPSGGSTVTPTAVLDGAAWVASYKYAESTSAFPSDATARAGTTVNGRQVTISLSSALALGDSVYVTALPYSVTAAGGVEGASIRLKGTRHDFSATKTVRFAANDFHQVANTGTFAGVGQLYFDNNYAHPVTSVAPIDFAGTTILELPNGVTITKVEAELYTSNSPNPGAADSITIYLNRISATGGSTNIGSVGSTSHNGWETKNFTCSEDTTGRQYQVYVDGHENDGGANKEPKIAAYYVTYTMSTSTVAL